jgi:hypothetical protein
VGLIARLSSYRDQIVVHIHVRINDVTAGPAHSSGGPSLRLLQRWGFLSIHIFL